MATWCVYRKGLSAQYNFFINGGWPNFPAMLEDLGIRDLKECDEAWWETLEIAPEIPATACLPNSPYNWEIVKIYEVVNGRAFLRAIDSIVWGAHQEIRLIDLSYRGE